MTLEDLIAQFRSDAFDQVTPYGFSDDDVTDWLNEAEREAALRGDLIHESEEAAMCEVEVTAGTQRYDLHAKWGRVTDVFWLAEGGTDPTDRVRLDIIDRKELDRIRPAWRTTEEDPLYVIVEEKRLRLGCLPENDGTLYLEGYRLPLEDMTADADTPEIATTHHEHLVDWAVFRAFSRPDSELQNPQRAADADARFTAYFGLPLDANMLRATEAHPHVTKAWL